MRAARPSSSAGAPPAAPLAPLELELDPDVPDVPVDDVPADTESAETEAPDTPSRPSV